MKHFRFACVLMRFLIKSTVSDFINSTQMVRLLRCFIICITFSSWTWFFIMNLLDLWIIHRLTLTFDTKASTKSPFSQFLVSDTKLHACKMSCFIDVYWNYMWKCIEFSNTISKFQVWHVHWGAAGPLSNLQYIKSAHIHINSLSQTLHCEAVNEIQHFWHESLNGKTGGFPKTYVMKNNSIMSKIKEIIHQVALQILFFICSKRLVNLINCPNPFQGFVFHSYSLV